MLARWRRLHGSNKALLIIGALIVAVLALGVISPKRGQQLSPAPQPTRVQAVAAPTEPRPTVPRAPSPTADLQLTAIAIGNATMAARYPATPHVEQASPLLRVSPSPESDGRRYPPGTVFSRLGDERNAYGLWHRVRAPDGYDGWIAEDEAAITDKPVELPPTETPQPTATAEPEAPQPTRTAVVIRAIPTPIPAYTGGIRCRDGTISHAAHRQGACSHHGGIAD